MGSWRLLGGGRKSAFCSGDPGTRMQQVGWTKVALQDCLVVDTEAHKKYTHEHVEHEKLTACETPKLRATTIRDSRTTRTEEGPAGLECQLSPQYRPRPRGPLKTLRTTARRFW